MLTIQARADTADDYFAKLRSREFKRLDDRRQVYLDYAGSALYGESQLRAHRSLLEKGLFGNPHSENEPSRASTALIDAARTSVLRFLGVDADSHVVCFTANATAAIKLVAESYPFGPGAVLALSADNHNSINGIREFARRAGASARYLPLDGELRLDCPFDALTAAAKEARGGLFAFPAQSNFSGVRHPLALVRHAKALGFDVLLDAAAFLPTAPLTLRECDADFVALSFYKLFGYPTGLGALVARRDGLARLRRPWFAGGTVSFASVQMDAHELRSIHEGFEDGTPDFLSIAAVSDGLAVLERAGIDRIAAHVSRLTGSLLARLQALRHSNGAPMVRVYGPETMRERGGIIAVNVLDPCGRTVPYPVVEARAREAGVSVRGGCFCNPGASEAAFGYDRALLERCLAPGFTVERFAGCAGEGVAVGAVRLSLGLANNDADIERAVDVVQSFRS